MKRKGLRHAAKARRTKKPFARIRFSGSGRPGHERRIRGTERGKRAAAKQNRRKEAERREEQNERRREAAKRTARTANNKAQTGAKGKRKAAPELPEEGQQGRGRVFLRVRRSPAWRTGAAHGQTPAVLTRRGHCERKVSITPVRILGKGRKKPPRCFKAKASYSIARVACPELLKSMQSGGALPEGLALAGPKAKAAPPATGGAALSPILYQLASV